MRILIRKVVVYIDNIPQDDIIHELKKNPSISKFLLTLKPCCMKKIIELIQILGKEKKKAEESKNE